MSAQEYAFLVLAVVGGLSSIAVVTARNVVHAALYLVVTLLRSPVCTCCSAPSSSPGCRS